MKFLPIRIWCTRDGHLTKRIVKYSKTLRLIKNKKKKKKNSSIMHRMNYDIHA